MDGRVIALTLTLLLTLSSVAGARMNPTWLGGGGTVESGGVSVSDNFNRVDGGLGANWTTITGSYIPTVSFYHVVPSGGGTSSAIYTGATFSANQKACADLRVADQAWVLVRGDSGNSYYYLASNNTGSVLLRKRVAGDAATTMATYSHPGGTATLCLSVSGGSTTSLTASINGTPESTINDSSSPLTSGAPGVGVYGGWVDNFTAEDL